MTEQATEKHPINAGAVVESFGDLATLAPVALEVLRLADDERAGLSDVTDAISRDPGLASQLLRVANSSLYGMGGEVASLERAAMILGTRTVKLLSLSFAVVAKTATGSADNLIWRRTLAGSAMAQTVAGHCEPRLADEVFISALLANMGRMAMLSEPRYADAQAEAGGWLDSETEEALFGVSGDSVTALILDGWGLPSALGQAISSRSKPSTEQGQAGRMAALLAVADSAAAFLTATEDEASSKLDRYQTRAQDLLTLDIETADQLLVDSQPALEDIAAMFQHPTPTDAPVTELLLRAREGLARLSLDAVAALSMEQNRSEQLANENLRLTEEASTDSLTGLHNRRSFDERLDGSVGARMRHQQPGGLALLILDLDHFKSINDTWGHQVGDEVIQAVAFRLSANSRVDEIVARIGGEEFSVILPISTLADAEAVAERLRGVIASEPIETEAGPLNTTISVGVALVETVDVNTPREIIRSADRALYVAKNEGRNRCHTAPMST